MTAAPRTERNSNRRWKGSASPRAILLIRLHATGDVALTTPYAHALATALSPCKIDFLTTDVCAGAVTPIRGIHRVIQYRWQLSRSLRIFTAILLALKLRRNHYDIVIDLQRSWMSRMMRWILSPRAWSEFDRHSPLHATLRISNTIAACGIVLPHPLPSVVLSSHGLDRARARLISAGWDARSPLVVLNPAGLWETRQWAIKNYIDVARRLIEMHNVRILLIGTNRVRTRADEITSALPLPTISFVGETTLEEAFCLLAHAALIISEDSGLMHMAWAVGIPIITLFGSSEHHRAAPVGENTVVFHSGDLSCSSCMQPSCAHGDVRCLMRVTTDRVCEAAELLLGKGTV